MSILDNTILKKNSFYPIVLGLYPILSLVTSNLERVPVYTQLGSIILPGAAILMTWVVLRRIIKDPHKADLISALIGFAFFSYGHLLRAISILMITIYGSSFDVLERFGRLTDHPDVLQKIFIGWVIFLHSGCVFVAQNTH